MAVPRRIRTEDLMKPGWRSFLLSLGIWYLLVTLYMAMGSSSKPVLEKYWFYTRYSWPNFLLCYLNIVWLVPRLLHSRRVGAYLGATTGALAAYVGIRYYNHILQNPDMYTYLTRAGDELVKVNLSITEIVKAEVLKGLQFILLSLAYGFILDRIVTEQRITRLEREKLRADLSMLRYQLNPHFLFNTINDIYYLALIRSTHTADALLELSELLRYVLLSKDDRVGMDREVDHLRRFVNLHRFRFPDCCVNLSIDTGPDPERWAIPPLVLISFTENAFKHRNRYPLRGWATAVPRTKPHRKVGVQRPAVGRGTGQPPKPAQSALPERPQSVRRQIRATIFHRRDGHTPATPLI
jgi:hypothetical protein